MFELIKRAQAITFPSIAPVEDTVTLDDTIALVVTWFLGIAGAIAVIYLIYGGILYITAGGDAEKATKGRTALINAIIGIIIILLAILIVRWVISIVSSGNA